MRRLAIVLIHPSTPWLSGSRKPAAGGTHRFVVALLQHPQHFDTAPHCRGDCVLPYQRIPANWGRVMTMNLLSREQITPIQDHFATVEITDADFNRIEVIGDLIRHIEIVDTRGDNMRRS